MNLSVVECFLEDYVTLRDIANISSQDEFHTDIAIFHLSVEVRVLGRSLQRTDLEINAI